MTIIKTLASMTVNDEFLNYNYYKYRPFIDDDYYFPDLESQKNFRVVAIFINNYFKTYKIPLPDDTQIRLYADQSSDINNHLGSFNKERITLFVDEERMDFIFCADETIHCRLYKAVRSVYNQNIRNWKLSNDYEVVNFENGRKIFSLIKRRLVG